MNMNELVNTAAIEQFVERIGVHKVFGKPTTEGSTTIIPVAQVEFGFGYGGGFGAGPGGDTTSKMDEGGASEGVPNEGVPNEERASEGGGSGGGAGGRSTPRGYIHIAPDGVKYTPIMDELRVPIGGLLLAAWSVFWGTLAIRAIAKAVIASRRQG